MRTTFLIAAFLSLNACLLRTSGDGMTTSQASEALDEASVSAQASELTSASIDVSTNFTIGEAAEQAAQDLSAFIQSQLPCASITLSGNTLAVVYGANPGACTYDGHTFSGSETISISPNGTGVEVDHTWTKFSDGVVTVSGTANVTWDAVNPSRHVVHSLDWTRVWDNRTGHGTADLTQTPLSGGVVVGFQESGTRTWTGESGEWTLDVNDVQVRWADPVPQSGSYVLTTPDAKTATLSFSRVDASTIAVELTSGNSTFTFDVTETGQTS